MHTARKGMARDISRDGTRQVTQHMHWQIHDSAQHMRSQDACRLAARHAGKNMHKGKQVIQRSTAPVRSVCTANKYASKAILLSKELTAKHAMTMCSCP